MFQVVRGGRIAIGAATLAQDSKKLGGKYVEDRGFLQQAGQLSFHNRKYRSPIVPAPVVFNYSRRFLVSTAKIMAYIT